MIPYRLQFSGIRDFEPTSIDLSGDGHVMITGPNGSGKSTLTFCMGAALYSSKIDIEGLKSRNLPSEQVWRAHVSFLFKNDGPMKIDEPPFIQFTIYIVQEPGQPIKKEFLIQKGEEIDVWEETIKYTSGDSYHNFTAYKRDLQFRYKIHPDLFYLIWYQQEVNQFAVMNPEERFRIFSEMHGIDEMQRNWEEAMEQVRVAEGTMRQAEQNMLFHKQQLSFLKTAMDRFKNNQKRLRTGATDTLEALYALEILYNEEIKTLKRTIEDLEEQVEETKENASAIAGEKETANEQLMQLEAEKKEIENQITQISNGLESASTGLTTFQTEKATLEKELESLMIREKRIERSEEETKQEYTRLVHIDDTLAEEQHHLEEEMEEQEATRNQLIKDIAELKAQIEQDERLEKVHQERVVQFGSSFLVQEKIKKLDERIYQNRDVLHTTKKERTELSREKTTLEKDQNVSERQEKSLRYFRARGIDAFPLRELIELDDSAKLSDENLFRAIKYTIFFNGKTASPPTDLYHVPLMQIVPERWKDHLPMLHLRIKSNLSGDKHNHAVKALFWVGQFFKKEKPTIQNGVLIDVQGIRGPQEKQNYILSQKAIQLRIQEIDERINDLTNKEKALRETIERDTESFQYLNSEIQKVKEAEAFMTNRQEREQRKKKWALLAEKEVQFGQLLEELRAESLEYMKKRAEIAEQLKLVQKDLDFYKELGQSREKYERLQYVTQREEEMKEKVGSLKRKLDQLEAHAEHVNRNVSRTKRKIDDMRRKSDDMEREKVAQSRQLETYRERLEVYENELVQTIQEIEDMKQIVPELYQAFINDFVEEEKQASEEVLKKKLENARITFQTARQEEGIDPAAEENYHTAKKEYERLEEEFKQSNILLEADKERTEKLKDDLEKTINMRVLEIRRRFIVYMGEFQFQGDISWESLEDKQGRTHFHLYIKARKEGHQGTMEDVSVKARGGKHAKGVSGGEESLSSLLFALALLQNIETAPGFIVLDEFDSALDEDRKSKVFDLYANQLQRKLIILTPKTHEKEYLDRFNKAFIVHHDPRIPRSKVTGIVKR